MPIEPVRPTIRGRLGSLTQRLFEFGTQAGADDRSNAIKRFECRNGLMHQHAEAIDDAMTAAARLLQQRGLQRVVNDVADSGVPGQRVQRECERSIAPHAGAGGVQQERDIG